MLQMGGSIRGFGLVCQGHTWHSMLRAGGFPWARAFRAGTVRRVYGVHIRPVIKRQGLRVRMIDIGLGVPVLKFRNQG